MSEKRMVFTALRDRFQKKPPPEAVPEPQNPFEDELSNEPQQEYDPSQRQIIEPELTALGLVLPDDPNSPEFADLINTLRATDKTLAVRVSAMVYDPSISADDEFMKDAERASRRANMFRDKYDEYMMTTNQHGERVPNKPLLLGLLVGVCALGFYAASQHGITGKKTASTQAPASQPTAIKNADGSSVSTNANGDVTTTSPDGTATTKRANGDVVVKAPDGTTTTTFADGHKMTGTASGQTTEILADGTTITRDASGNIIGNLPPSGSDPLAAVKTSDLVQTGKTTLDTSTKPVIYSTPANAASSSGEVPGTASTGTGSAQTGEAQTGSSAAGDPQNGSASPSTTDPTQTSEISPPVTQTSAAADPAYMQTPTYTPSTTPTYTPDPAQDTVQTESPPSNPQALPPASTSPEVTSMPVATSSPTMAAPTVLTAPTAQTQSIPGGPTPTTLSAALPSGAAQATRTATPVYASLPAGQTTRPASQAQGAPTQNDASTLTVAAAAQTPTRSGPTNGTVSITRAGGSPAGSAGSSAANGSASSSSAAAGTAQTGGQTATATGAASPTYAYRSSASPQVGRISAQGNAANTNNAANPGSAGTSNAGTAAAPASTVRVFATAAQQPQLTPNRAAQNTGAAAPTPGAGTVVFRKNAAPIGSARVTPAPAAAPASPAAAPVRAPVDAPDNQTDPASGADTTPNKPGAPGYGTLAPSSYMNALLTQNAGPAASAPGSDPTSSNPAISPQAAGTPASAPVPSPYRVGQKMRAQLSTGVLATSNGQKLPVYAQTEDGTTWLGQVSLSDTKRVEIEFTLALLKNGTQIPVTAQAFNLDGSPGIKAQYKDIAPTLANDLIRGAVGGVRDYVEAKIQATTTTNTSNSQTVQRQAPSIWESVAGSAASVFQLPPTTQTFVTVAELRAGSAFVIVNGLYIAK